MKAKKGPSTSPQVDVTEGRRLRFEVGAGLRVYEVLKLGLKAQGVGFGSLGFVSGVQG